MKKNIKILLLTITCCSVLHAQDHLRLWYEKPANTWVEALPLGNGYIGAMVYGKVEDELIQLNTLEIGRASCRVLIPMLTLTYQKCVKRCREMILLQREL